MRQIMLTTIEPARHRRDTSYDAYEYTVHSHTYNMHDIPSAKACAPQPLIRLLGLRVSLMITCMTDLG